MFENYDDVLTVEEACEALKIGYNAMYALLNIGKLRGYRNGRVWRMQELTNAFVNIVVVVYTPFLLGISQVFRRLCAFLCAFSDFQRRDFYPEKQRKP